MLQSLEAFISEQREKERREILHVIAILLLPHGWITCGAHYLRRQSSHVCAVPCVCPKLSCFFVFFSKFHMGEFLQERNSKKKEKGAKEKRQHKHKPNQSENKSVLLEQ